MTAAPSSVRGKTVLALLAAGILAGAPLQAAEPVAPAAKTYTAVAVLLVERQEPSIVARGGETVDPGEFEMFRATQMQLIKSRWVILAALRDSKIKDLPIIRRADATHVAVRMLANAIRVQAPDPHAGVVTVSITTYDPGEAAALVNAIVGAYMNEVVQYDRLRRRELLSRLQLVSAEKELEVRTKKEDLRRAAENLGVTLTPDAARVKLQLAADRVSFLQQRVLALQEDRDRVNIELKVGKEHGGDTKPLEQQQEIVADRLSGCEKKLEKASREADALGRSSISLEIALADVQSLERVLAKIADERELLRVNLNASPRVRVVGDPNNPAQVPELPD
jgi:uncharacterized protein involved in exopolysaccharide biosynthesis